LVLGAFALAAFTFDAFFAVLFLVAIFLVAIWRLLGKRVRWLGCHHQAAGTAARRPSGVSALVRPGTLGKILNGIQGGFLQAFGEECVGTTKGGGFANVRSDLVTRSGERFPFAVNQPTAAGIPAVQ
jgi:hypothetical protein